VSYLDSPRLHFRGWFQADVSTINNAVTAYELPPAEPFDPGWNPQGTGIFRFLDCAVTGAYLDGKQITDPSGDPVIGMTIQNANQRAPGKLVDLDPQQQMVSMIFGMQVRIVSPALETVMQSEFKPAPFINLWPRQLEGVPMDQQLGAVYQSILEGVEWPTAAESPVLDALRKAAPGGKLSIDFNVFGYGRDPKIPRYTMGHVVGTIGPYREGEPEHFVLGRQMINQGGMFNPPTGNIATLQAKVGDNGRSLTVDFGNSFEIETANSGLKDIGTVLVGVLNSNPDQVLSTVDAAGVTVIGEVPYTGKDWYTQTAGVQTFPLSANGEAMKLLPANPLVLLGPSASTVVPPVYSVLLQESVNGVYVRADQFVFRIEPGASQTIDFYATQFGAPLANAAITLSNASALLASLGGTPPDISVPTDGVNVPVGSDTATITAGADGHAQFTLQANANGLTVNGNPWPRGYLEGQLYALGYQLEAQPANYVPNPFNFVSILAYSQKYNQNPNNPPPTWYDDIQPLFAQYSNLYPIMSKYVVDLSDYDSVVSRIGILYLAFSLPESDPNHMPVTRDLGAADRAVILQWLGTTGPDGLPPRGTPPAPKQVAAAGEAEPEDLLPIQKAGKTAVILRYERALAKAGKGDKK